MLRSDQEILDGLMRNDRATAEYVYKTLAPPLFKYVLSNNGTREEAKDVFQETFLRVMNRIQAGKYSDQQKFEGYFLTIARNIWIDQLRHKKQYAWSNQDDFLLQRADESDEEALLYLIQQDGRMEALLTVWKTWDDTECHRILKMFHFDGMRTKDIAEAEGTSQNTLLQRLFKCRSKLFKLVSGQPQKKKS